LRNALRSFFLKRNKFFFTEQTISAFHQNQKTTIIPKLPSSFLSRVMNTIILMKKDGAVLHLDFSSLYPSLLLAHNGNYAPRLIIVEPNTKHVSARLEDEDDEKARKERTRNQRNNNKLNNKKQKNTTASKRK